MTGAQTTPPLGTLADDGTAHAPRPDAICLDCRRVLVPGESCGGERPHRTTTLTTLRGRERLRDVVWGREGRRRQLLRRTDQETIGAELAEEAGGGLSLLGALIHLVEVPLRRFLHLRPHGAATLPTVRMVGAAVAAEIVASCTTTAPLTGRSCAAWAVTICAERVASGSEVMCRQAWCGGFDALGAGGARLLVPRGRLLFHPAPGVGERVDGRPLKRHVDLMLGRRWSLVGLDFPVFPASHAWEAILVPGDHVVVSGRLERREGDGPRGLPRDPVATFMQAAGLVSVERLAPDPARDSA